MSPGLTGLRLAWREGGLRGPVLIALGASLLLGAGAVPGGAGRCGGGHHAAAGPACAPLLLAEWLVMVAAMMTPLLVPTVNHVWRSSLRHRRADALLALGAGYGLCWAAAGLVLLPVATTIGHGWITAAALFASALAWSCSPVAQYARNRCHRVRGIDPFGLAADRDSFVQGAMAGGPCVLACWPWMLVPMSAPAGHAALTAAVTLILFLERLAAPRAPSWRPPPASETLRLLFPLRKAVR